MSTATEHTPLPWSQGNFWWDIEGPMDEYIGQVVIGANGSETAKANVAFILRAVNNHARLIEAAKVALEEVDYWYCRDPSPRGRIVAEQLKAAIEKASQEEKPNEHNGIRQLAS